MTRTVMLFLAGSLTLTAGCREKGVGSTSTEKRSAAKPAAADVAPVAVSVVAIDPDAKTITVREISAVPAPPGKPVEITLPVPATATGQKVADTRVGDEVNVTCAVKPTVHPTAGVPVVLTDCVEVAKIEPRS